MPTTVLVVVDGLRPDAILMANCPQMGNLLARSSYTFQASSVMPSVTLPCHMSIFHSVPPTRHGITTNEWQPMARPLPGLIDQARAANHHTASFYNWEPLRNLSLPGSLNFSYCRDNVYADLEADRVIADEAVRYIAGDAPDFAFVYFGTVDTIGHRHGWMSDEYLAQVARVDGALGALLDGLPADSTLLLLSDHGGHERSHGTDAAEDMTIPWLVAGPAIRRGYEISTPVSLLDTAPTLAHILNIAPHRDWDGRCIAEIFNENSEQ
jgi:predicted AlkP superfamily pyrophosphatase or phosphodiesterase